MEAQLDSDLSQGHVDLRVGKCRPRFWELLRALFEHGAIIFPKKAHHHCGVFAVLKNVDQRLIIDARIPNTAFEALDLVALATGQSFARVNVDTNDPIFVSGVDIQLAFYAMATAKDNLRPFKMCSHLTSSKRWKLILLTSSTRALWTTGLKWCAPFSLWFLWIRIKL